MRAAIEVGDLLEVRMGDMKAAAGETRAAREMIPAVAEKGAARKAGPPLKGAPAKTAIDSAALPEDADHRESSPRNAAITREDETIRGRTTRGEMIQGGKTAGWMIPGIMIRDAVTPGIDTGLTR